jgi:hypothetical protein
MVGINLTLHTRTNGKASPACSAERANKAASVHSLRVVSGLKTGTQPDLAPETDDP